MIMMIMIMMMQVSPQPKSPGGRVAVTTSQFLAVKVEGVIQRSRSTKIKEGRQVAGVVVQLDSALQEKSKGEQTGKGDVTTVSLEQEAEPHHDFFSVQVMMMMMMMMMILTMTSSLSSSWCPSPCPASTPAHWTPGGVTGRAVPGTPAPR